MNIKFTKFIPYIILCIIAALLFYTDKALLSGFNEISSIIYTIVWIFIACVIFAPLLGVVMHLAKPIKITIEILLFILLCGFCVLFAFPLGMVIGKYPAIFIFSLIPTIFAGAHFVSESLAAPSPAYKNLMERGVPKAKIVRLTSFKLAYATVFCKADYLLCLIMFTYFSAAYLLGVSLTAVFAVAPLILLACLFAGVCLLSLIIAKILYR